MRHASFVGALDLLCCTVVVLFTQAFEVVGVVQLCHVPLVPILVVHHSCGFDLPLLQAPRAQGVGRQVQRPKRSPPWAVVLPLVLAVLSFHAINSRL